MKYFLTILVFVGGVTSLALEISATRLLCTYLSGLLYAISTIGSLFGYFLPVLWLIPTIGVRRTVLLFEVEIDPAIVEVKHRYFDVNEPNLHVYIEDGRTFLATTHARYNVIVIDIFDQPYISFQSTTRESFLQLHDQIAGPSTLVLNTVHTTHDYRPVQAFANTMKQVFPSVYTFNVPNSINTEITATKEPTSITTFQQNLARFSPTSTLGQVTNEILPVV